MGTMTNRRFTDESIRAWIVMGSSYLPPPLPFPQHGWGCVFKPPKRAVSGLKREIGAAGNEKPEVK